MLHLIFKSDLEINLPKNLSFAVILSLKYQFHLQEISFDLKIEDLKRCYLTKFLFEEIPKPKSLISALHFDHIFKTTSYTSGCNSKKFKND
jgi:hypothetical protein